MTKPPLSPIEKTEEQLPEQPSKNAPTIEEITPEPVNLQTEESTPSSPIFAAIPEGLKTINTHGLPILILATATFIFSMQVAKAFFIPIIFSVLLAYTLNPIVTTLERWKISRTLSTAIVLLTLLLGTGLATSSLVNEFNSILVRLPEAARQLTKEIARTQDDQPSTMQQIQAVATELETAANQSTPLVPLDADEDSDGIAGKVASGKNSISKKQKELKNKEKNPKSATNVSSTVNQEHTLRFQVRDWILAGSFGVVGFIGQMTMIFFLLFFLLASGDRYKRKLVKITGPSLSSKKITVLILDAINKSIQNYMFMLLVTTLILIILMWISLRLLGVENAGAWAVAAGCLHLIPYIGTVIFTGALAASVLVQFGSFSQVTLVVAVTLGVTVLVGIFITTWMTGRIAKMNPLAIFIGLLFWGWLWGIWGLLLGVPIIMMIRVVAEHVDGLQSVAELLSE
jgi:predicted PurR-regulated permease PerM